MRALLCALAIVAGTFAPVRASQTPLPSGVTPCAFEALTNDPDPKGLNIRESPSASARVLGTLPRVTSPLQGVGDVEADFRVVGTRDGWFLIDGAHYGYGYSGKQPYAGRGWVSGKLITTGLRRLYLKSGPRDDARDVARLQSKDFSAGPDSFTPSLLDCSGKWFRVELPIESGNLNLQPLLPTDAPKGFVRGWTDSYCIQQLTTCV